MAGRREDDPTTVTVYEVYRKLVDMDERYEAKLNGIDKQVRITNGRTTTLEAEMRGVKEDVRDIRLGVMPVPSTPPSLPVMTQEGESISVKVSPKMWAAFLVAAPVAWYALISFGKWIEQLLERAR